MKLSLSNMDDDHEDIKVDNDDDFYSDNSLDSSSSMNYIFSSLSSSSSGDELLVSTATGIENSIGHKKVIDFCI